MPLNTKQKEAVEYMRGPLLVLAGPGTGKTQLLSQKIKYILDNTDALASNILCLTFTDAGAQNMYDRLLSMAGGNDPDKEKVVRKVGIYTYHSFGSYILSEYKNFAENFDRNLDSPIDTVTQFNIVQEIQNSLPVTDILKTANPKDIIATITEAKSARLDFNDLRLIATTNLNDTLELNPKLNDILSPGLSELKQVKNSEKLSYGLENIYLPILNILSEYTSDTPIAKNIFKEANEIKISLELATKNAVVDETEIKSILGTSDETAQNSNQEQSAKKPSISPLTKWKDNTFEVDKNGNYVLKNRVANKKLLSLASVMEAYDNYLKTNNLFDFADMIQESIKILKTDEAFRLTMREKFLYILLDEYQDTNPSQLELVDLLLDDEQPMVTAVGDDDQAIFEFQGANSSNLLDFQRKYHAKVVVLTENYRSTQEILDFGRKIADQIDDSFANTEGIEKDLTSVRNTEITDNITAPHLNPEVPSTYITRHEFIESGAEYAWIAEQIENLIHTGVRQSEIAIITSKHKYIAPLLPYLKAYDNINVAYERRENILEDERIIELSTLARFIFELSENKNPAFRLMEILSYPFWNLPAVDIVTTLQSSFNDKRKSLDYLLGSTNENFQLLGNFFAELVKKSATTPLEEFIDYLTGVKPLESFTSPFLAFYTENQTDFSEFTLYENLNILKENLKSHIKTEKPRLRDFIKFLEDYETAGEAILNTNPYQDSENSVQIMTAHKSKGLEFTHVFLTSVDNLNWGNGKGNNNLLVLPKNLTKIRHSGATDGERLRLFFVAITRAKATLTLTNSRSDFTGKRPKRLDYLNEYEVTDTEVASKLIPGESVVEHLEPLSPEKRRENIEKNWISSYVNPDPNLLPILKTKMKDYRLTATGLTTFIDITYGGPLEFYKTYVLNGPREQGSDSIEFGNLIHLTFEAVTNQNLSDEAALDFYRTELEKLDLEDNTKQDLKTKGELAVRESLKAFSSILRHKDSKAELNLGHERLMLGKIPITGKIDHINIDKENKTIEVYDFKTSKFHDEKNWFSNTALTKYALQLGFYKLLLNNSSEYRNYKIEKAHILFVSPSANEIADESELVHDKVFEFTADFEKDLTDLISAVYKHIETLDFINSDSPLAVLPDKNKNAKELREFIEKVKETAQ